MSSQITNTQFQQEQLERHKDNLSPSAQGYYDYFQKVKLDENPFQDGSIAALEWLENYLVAENDDKMWKHVSMGELAGRFMGDEP